MAITDTEIKRAKPEQKPYSMSDSGGSATWLFPGWWQALALEVPI